MICMNQSNTQKSIAGPEAAPRLRAERQLLQPCEGFSDSYPRFPGQSAAQGHGRAGHGRNYVDRRAVHAHQR